MLKTLGVGFAFTLAIICAHPGHAAITTVYLSGEVVSVDTGIVNPAFTVGSPFTAQVDFDSAEPPSFLDASFAAYSAIRFFSATVGSYSASARNGDITVYDDFHDLCETASDVFCTYPVGGGQLYGAITSVTVVPEPVVLQVVLLGLPMIKGIAMFRFVVCGDLP